MKHLLSLILCGFSFLFGLCAWVAVQIEPDHWTPTADLPKRAADALDHSACDAVVISRVNPAQITGAAIHHDLAHYPA